MRNLLRSVFPLVVYFIGAVLWLMMIWQISATVTRGHVKSELASTDYSRSLESELEQCRKLPANQAADCAARKVERSRGDIRGELDLDAQNTMATWTAVVGVVAMAGFVSGLIGIALVFLTFREQRLANTRARREFLHARRDARLAAKAADATLTAAQSAAISASNQVDIATESAYRQLRAYISIEGVETWPVAGQMISGTFKIRNAGATPASILVYLSSWIGAIGPELKGGEPEPARLWSVNPYINANCVEKIDWFHPGGAKKDPVKIAELIAKPTEQLIYIRGRVEFQDYSGKKRTLHFGFRNHGPIMDGARTEMIPTPFGNEYETE